MAELPVSEGVRSLLAAHVGTSGWALYTAIMPDTPNKVILVTDTQGDTPNPKWLLDFPALQVRVRGMTGSYIATWVEAKAVKDILLGIDSQDVNGDRWLGINMIGDLTFLRWDEEQRPEFVMNFSLIIEPQSVANSNRTAL